MPEEEAGERNLWQLWNYADALQRESRRLIMLMWIRPPCMLFETWKTRCPLSGSGLPQVNVLRHLVCKAEQPDVPDTSMPAAVEESGGLKLL